MKTNIYTVLILIAAFLALLHPAHAQNQSSTPRIGILSGGAPNPNLDLFVEQLRQLGHNEGKNLQIEYRFANGHPDHLSELAWELVQLKVEAIFAPGPPAIFAVKQATKIIPVVFFSTSDPVGMGVVSSLAQPGGNFTGISALASGLWPKRLELLKEIAPKLSKVAMVWNKGNAGMMLEAKKTQELAVPLGVALEDRGIKDPKELEAVFAAITKDRPDGFLALADVFLNTLQKRILDFLVKNHLPAVFESREWVEAGGLISYGPSYAEMFRRAAFQMDKVLKGTKPTDIPVEQPMNFELVINLRTAKQIGLIIPPTVLIRADKVIR